MSNKQILVSIEITDDALFSLEELAEICGTSVAWLKELLEQGVLEPLPGPFLQFDLRQLRRVQAALRLARDLEINHAGIALILDLLDEIERLRAQAEILQKQFLHLF